MEMSSFLRAWNSVAVVKPWGPIWRLTRGKTLEEARQINSAGAECR